MSLFNPKPLVIKATKYPNDWVYQVSLVRFKFFGFISITSFVLYLLLILFKFETTLGIFLYSVVELVLMYWAYRRYINVEVVNDE